MISRKKLRIPSAFWNAAAFAIFIGLTPKSAAAYTDPGTAGILLQLLLGGTAGGLVIIKLYWHKLKSLFRREKPEPDSSPSIDQ